MRLIRCHGLASSLLALFLSGSLFLPEAGHTVTHVRVAEHHVSAGNDHHDDAGYHDEHDGHPVGLASSEDHPHLDMAATVAAKAPTTMAIVVAVPAPVFAGLSSAPRMAPVDGDESPPGTWAHAPPPPSRAPPLA